VRKSKGAGFLLAKPPFENLLAVQRDPDVIITAPHFVMDHRVVADFRQSDLITLDGARDNDLFVGLAAIPSHFAEKLDRDAIASIDREVKRIAEDSIIFL
jgi:hypothetical protein